MTDRCYYVYAHYRKSDGRIFYVGKGKGARAWQCKGRSDEWKILCGEGFYYKIIARFFNEQCALSMEKCLIATYGISKLANKTIGGQGASGFKMPEDKKRTPWKAKKVISSDGDIFNCVSMAAQFLVESGIKASKQNIANAASGKQACAYGLGWSYDISKTPKFSPRHFKRKKVFCLEENMEFESIVDAKRWIAASHGLKISGQHIGSCASGKRQTAYGYTWKYV